VTPTCYHGARLGNGGYRIIAHQRETGERYPLPHIVRHSPRGFAWGYVGSAPADLARSLLIDVLGPAAACPLCNGTGYVAWTGGDDTEPYDRGLHHDLEPAAITECICTDGRRNLPYLRFEYDQVARWGDHWSITRAEVLRWLVRAYGERTPGWLLEVIGVVTVELPELPS
jgi:hypothetical protein